MRDRVAKSSDQGIRISPVAIIPHAPSTSHIGIAGEPFVGIVAIGPRFHAAAVGRVRSQASTRVIAPPDGRINAPYRIHSCSSPSWTSRAVASCTKRGNASGPDPVPSAAAGKPAISSRNRALGGSFNMRRDVLSAHPGLSRFGDLEKVLTPFRFYRELRTSPGGLFRDMMRSSYPSAYANVGRS